MGVSLVYLGEHYVLDVIAGYAVALVAYALVWLLPQRLPRRVQLPRPALTLPRNVRPAALAGEGGATLRRLAWCW
jgi:membrane-associated phospholipid phosphatase